jgi:hypothetical protein
MTLFVVRVHYAGIRTYVIDAGTAGNAEEIATAAFKAGKLAASLGLTVDWVENAVEADEVDDSDYADGVKP